MLTPLAYEGALKLKEISYIHAEAYASGEMKHGPIALVEKGFPVINLAASNDGLFEKTLSNLKEIEARHGQVILLTDEAGAGMIDDATRNNLTLLTVPTVDALLLPIVFAVPLQLLAYYTAVAKGTDVDQPRNLAKSVTVE
jgi:glucosamine--fructose-6-phosphate aminotransferase (isomerizing)